MALNDGALRLESGLVFFTPNLIASLTHPTDVIHPLPIRCQSATNPLPIRYQSAANPLPIRCQSAFLLRKLLWP